MRTTSSLALAAFVTASACALHPAAAQQGAPDRLALSYIPSNSMYVDIDAGIDKGFFRKEGFAPQIINGQSSPQMIQMLISGSVEMSIGQPEPIMAAIVHGAKELGVISSPADRPDWYFLTSPEVKDWQDLKGKTIGFSSFRVGEYWLARQILSEHGLESTSYNAVIIGVTPLKMAAFAKGAIQGAVMFQPTGEAAARKGYHVLWRFSTMQSYPSIIYAVNRKWAAEKDHGKRLAKAFRDTHTWLYDPKNHDDVIAVMAKYTKRDRAVLEDIYKLYFVTDQIYTRDGSVDAKGLARLVSLMTRNGEIGTQAEPKPADYLLPASLGGMAR
jgi:ABC-type nitrate/sulfonate/bicarbonate transport system substrate-binding protein